MKINLKRKGTLFLALLMTFTSLLTGCEENKTNIDNKNKDSASSKVSVATAEQIEDIDKAIKELYKASYSYDQTEGIYNGSNSTVIYMDKNAKDEDIAKNTKDYRYYTKEEEGGQTKITMFKAPAHIVELGTNLENTSIRTRGFVNVLDKNKYEIYNENVLYIDKNAKPLLREYYKDGMLIKETGKDSDNGNNTKARRLPDEPIFTQALFNVVPFKTILEWGKKTSFIDEPQTSDGLNFYILTKNVSNTMFVNEVFVNLYKDPELFKKYLEELNKFGINTEDANSNGYLALVGQTYFDVYPSVENLLRDQITYLCNQGVLRDRSKLKENIKESGIDLKETVGAILKKQYETKEVPLDTTVTGYYLNIEKSDDKVYLKNLVAEKIYEDMMGKLKTINYSYEKDKNYDNLLANSEALNKLNINNKINPIETAEMRAFRDKNYLEMFTKTVPLDVLYQSWYEHMRNINKGKELSPDSKELAMLNGLDKEEPSREAVTNIFVEVQQTIALLSNLKDCTSCSEMNKYLLELSGDNANLGKDEKTNKKYDMLVYTTNPVPFRADFAYKDLDGEEINLEFEASREPVLFSSTYIKNQREETIKKVDELNKKEKENPGSTTKNVNKGKDISNKQEDIIDWSALRDNGLEEGKLKHNYKEIADSGLLNHMSYNDGYYKPFMTMYNKKIDNVTIKDKNGNELTIMDAIKQSKIKSNKAKTTLVIYGDVNCPYCENMMEYLGTHFKEIKDDYDFIFISSMDESLHDSTMYFADTLYNTHPENKKDLEYMFENKIFYGGDNFRDKTGLEYKPTVFYTDESGTVYNVSTGYSDDEAYNFYYGVDKNIKSYLELK